MSDVSLYTRGRRAAERGATCDVPTEYAGSHETAVEWLRGYNSIYGGNKSNTIQDAITLLTLADEGSMDVQYAIKQALVILERLA